MSSSDDIVWTIQRNLKRIIQRAEHLSEEFRRVMNNTRPKGNLGILRDLLEVDNMIRDVVAQLRQSSLQIDLNPNKLQLLKDNLFIADLTNHLSEMFLGMDKIAEYTEIQDGEIDNIVLETISSIEDLNGLN